MLTKRLLTASLLTAPLVACSTAQFYGTSSSRATQSTATPTATATATDTSTPTDTSTTTATSTDTDTDTDTATPTATATGTPTGTSTTTPTATSTCAAASESIGAQVAFMIDNSNSNDITDCPSPQPAGSADGVALYSCDPGTLTNREDAVLAAFDALTQVAASQPSNADAKSDLAVASFPTTSDYVNGWSIETAGNGWVDTTAANRAAVASAMLFTHHPIGMTPYGAAFDAATQLFSAAANDDRAKVAVLVTDGDPTDSDPSSVQAKADALRASGVEVIVVTYAGDRLAAHTAQMQEIDDSYFKNYGVHWYAPKYATFADYMNALIGSTGTNGLALTVATSGESLYVSDSSQLKSTFLGIIKTQAIGCQ